MSIFIEETPEKAVIEQGYPHIRGENSLAHSRSATLLLGVGL